MAHRAAGTSGWELAAASTQCWMQEVAGDPAFKAAIEWQASGHSSLALSCILGVCLFDADTILKICSPCVHAVCDGVIKLRDEHLVSGRRQLRGFASPSRLLMRVTVVCLCYAELWQPAAGQHWH